MSPRATLIRRHPGKLVLLAVSLLLAIPALLLIWAADQIASPSRRPLADYHKEYLADPAAHGMQIGRFTASDGTPCLVCTPHPSANPGERGKRIRDQLAGHVPALPAAGSSIGNLVLLHGRTGRKEDYLPIAERFCAAGFRCIIPDLPAHGENPVAVTTYGIREASLPARVLGEAAEKFHFAPRPAGLVGMSMGGSVATHAASLPDAPWESLVILCSFDSFPAVIRENTSRRIGSTLAGPATRIIGRLYKDRTGIPLENIQPHRLAANIQLPVLIAHGTDDHTIPITAGRRLFQSFSATPDRTWIEIPTAGHDNLLVTSYPIYSEMAAWCLRHLHKPHLMTGEPEP